MIEHLSYLDKLSIAFRLIWSQLFFATVFLMVARYIMIDSFITTEVAVDRASDFKRMWMTGMRFDLKVAAISTIPILLVGLFFSFSDKYWSYFFVVSSLLFSVILFVVLVVSIANYYYYQTYHSFIDIFAFGLIDDDTKAVLSNIWQDYPVVKIIVSSFSSLIVLFLFSILLLRLPVYIKPSIWVDVSYIIIGVAVIFILSRGSLSSIPLRRDKAQVSTSDVINKMVPNGIIAIDWALKDRRNDVSFSAVNKEDGIALQKDMRIFNLQGHTPENNWLASNKPNVVIALMESFGSNMLALDKFPENDLLGDLRPHFENDFLFKRFLSEDNGTAPSFAALFFQSPVQNISHSSAQNIKLEDNPFFLYKKQGYRTVFISPGNMMWRNLSNYLPGQGVDEVYDQNTLIEIYPEAESEMTTWGIPDEYAFKFAAKLLSENTGGPLFISILSITNHPPYSIPSNYNAKSILVTDSVRYHAEDGGIDQKEMMVTYQYSSDALGKFITEIKNSSVGDSTIIAATGDHQMRRVKAFYPMEQALDKAVPFYLYVPKIILSHCDWVFDPTRVGSHKDIMPTLYSYSLSGTSYLALAGRNLLSPQDDKQRAFGYNVTLWIDDKGAYPLTGQHVFYRWRDESSLILSKDIEAVDSSQIKRMEALPKLLRWDLNRRLKGFVVEETRH